MNQPLAALLRPNTLEDVVGQTHILGKDKALYQIVQSKKIPNMIFYGPPGVGKTTVAQIIANQTDMRLHKLNGTTASVADIRAVIDEVGTFAGHGGILLYIDEIQYFNKKQQQTLLEFMEDGSITLIASTTENPYFYVFSAILSRSTIFEFTLVDKEEIGQAVRRGFETLAQAGGKGILYDEEIVATIAQGCGGDVRKALNAVELSVQTAVQEEDRLVVQLALVQQLVQKSSVRYDRSDDEHYNVLSAFQKAIRGSDPDGALHYLARLLLAKDLPSICRRMLVIASEDIGLAHPQAVAIVKACVDSALQLGLPEGRIPLAQGVVLLATSPKSNSIMQAIDMAMDDVQKGRYGDIPAHLKDAHYGGASQLGHGNAYLYPHAFPNHWVAQPYLPKELAGRSYYNFGNNKIEQAAKAYWAQIKGEKQTKKDK